MGGPGPIARSGAGRGQRWLRPELGRGRARARLVTPPTTLGRPRVTAGDGQPDQP